MASLDQWRIAGIAAVLAAASVGLTARQGHEIEVQRWRAEQELALQADDGWLTVTGLFWVEGSLSHVGADPSNEMVLPAEGAPARLGAFEARDGRLLFQAEPGIAVTSQGRATDRIDLTPGPGAPAIDVGALTLFAIRRGDRVGIRVRDKNSAARRAFTTRSWYPIDPSYRVTARFTAYDEPRIVQVPNVLGDTTELLSPGSVEFTLGGRSLRLEPVLETPDARELFFIIGDETNGHETYGGGRFLYTDLPNDGTVVLDFNKLHNPPCVFTAFATCPLPPPQNKLAVRVEAGELPYGNPGRAGH